MDQLLPAFLERNYGEGVPYYAIASINMWICMLLPSLIAALTSHLETFAVLLPGLWIMALAPLWLSLQPSVAAAVAWVALLSVGEAVWVPRQSAWIANLAPEGREGVFLALLSLKSLFTAIPSTAFNGWLNAAFNPNCPSCRDMRDGGHFCSERAPFNLTAHHKLLSGSNSSGWACRAAGGEHHLCIGGSFDPGLVGTTAAELDCPATCQQCPGWSGDASTMWQIVLWTSVSSPLMVMLTLRWLRADGADE